MALCVYRLWPVVLVAAAAVLMLFSTGCSVGTAGRTHIDDERVVDVEASDVDLRDMARKMAAAIIENPTIAKSARPVHIAFLNIENRTLTVDFDSYNLQSKIRQTLLEYGNGKLVFLDKAQLDNILAERDAKRAGQVTYSKREDLAGVDYFLTGYAYSQRKVDAKGVMQAYHRYSFRLTDAETTVVIWEKDYEFKKEGQRGSAYR